MVFSRGKIRNKPVIMFNDDVLEVVDSYDYLCITFAYNGNFKLAIKKLHNMASKPLRIVISSRMLNFWLNIVQCNIFKWSGVPYKLMYKLYIERGNELCLWIMCIKILSTNLV